MKAKLAADGLDESIAALAATSQHEVLAAWAGDCAERVLPYVEAASPEEKRPRQAVEAGRAWVRRELKMTAARQAAFAAHSAAREVSPAAACAACRAAGHAAATAHVATHAVHAATYAVKAVYEAAGPGLAASAVMQEREWQYRHLIRLNEE
ncbi:putative immunity protein [Paenibacillus sp. FSL R7-0204]|uniref:putative immunity protein n=1 Tax=unclassified Paenibacillus TaxID=185978 RepID=UPI0003E2280E|nr:hypothetical protein [Paenibacillus sp. FSL R7-269]ETT50275.1 hypothetical protein C162_11911 [Paenibacillus sp. FSL R7-269]